MALGNKIGDYLKIEGKGISRYFYPISRLDQAGSFDILFKKIYINDQLAEYS